MRRFARFAKRLPKGTMNKVEASYQEHLELLKRAGEIFDYRWESIKIKLADNTWFNPDFIVFAQDGTVELHDTKGTKKVTRANGDRESVPWIEEDAKLKLKVVAELWPFRIYSVFKTPEGWQQIQY